MRPTKPKIFTIGLFTEKFLDPESRYIILCFNYWNISILFSRQHLSSLHSASYPTVSKTLIRLSLTFFQFNMSTLLPQEKQPERHEGLHKKLQLSIQQFPTAMNTWYSFVTLRTLLRMTTSLFNSTQPLKLHQQSSYCFLKISSAAVSHVKPLHLSLGSFPRIPLSSGFLWGSVPTTSIIALTMLYHYIMICLNVACLHGSLSFTSRVFSIVPSTPLTFNK